MTERLLRASAVIAGELVPDAGVLAVRGRIAAAGAFAALARAHAAAAVEELAGTLLPGALDLQVNGMGGRGVDEATPEALERVAEAVLAGGAAAFLPTLITAPFEELLEQVSAVAAWIDASTPPGPPPTPSRAAARTARGAGAARGAFSASGQSEPAAAGEESGAIPLGLHVEGPFLEVAGAHAEACFVDPTPERVDALLAAARGHLRLVTLAPGRVGAPEAVRRLRERGVAVALGHARSTAGFAACVDAGATLVTHLFNAMGPLHHREPGIPGLALDEPRLACSLIADGHHVHPAVMRLAWRALGPERTVLVTDAVAAAGMPDGAYALAGERLELAGGVVRDERGTLAGSALTFAGAVRGFRAAVGELGPLELAAITATTPARVLGAPALGALTPGAPALLTHLAPDGTWRALDART